jgi:hypothetical protein
MELFEKDVVDQQSWNEQFDEQQIGSPSSIFSGVSTNNQGTTTVGGRIIGAILEGCSIVSTSTGARVEFFKSPTKGLEAFDNNNVSIFQIITSGTSVGDIIMGNLAGQYVK